MTINAAAAPPAQDVTYIAKERCVVGTLREPGERFTWPRFAACPRYLTEVVGNDQATGKMRRSPPDAAKHPPGHQGVTPADIGARDPTPSGDVDSTTILKH